MNLYHIQATVHGVCRIQSFLEDHYIGIAWSGTGDLEHMSVAQIQEQLVQTYNLTNQDLDSVCGTLHTFVNEMQDGDYVVIADEEWMYVGDLGDYYYDDSVGTEEEQICHRRGVTWLGRVPLTEVNEKVQTFLSDRSTLATFQYPISQAQLDRGLAIGVVSESSVSPTVEVDQATIQAALQVLKEALQSEEEELRVRAATAILQYAKR